MKNVPTTDLDDPFDYWVTAADLGAVISCDCTVDRPALHLFIDSVSGDDLTHPEPGFHFTISAMVGANGVSINFGGPTSHFLDGVLFFFAITEPFAVHVMVDHVDGDNVYWVTLSRTDGLADWTT